MVPVDRSTFWVFLCTLHTTVVASLQVMLSHYTKHNLTAIAQKVTAALFKTLAFMAEALTFVYRLGRRTAPSLHRIAPHETNLDVLASQHTGIYLRLTCAHLSMTG